MILAQEKQVTSPELSKKLFDLGVRQDTMLKWACGKNNEKPRLIPYGLVIANTREYAAYSASEILMLISNKKHLVQSIKISPFEGKFYSLIVVDNVLVKTSNYSLYSILSAESMGKFLVYLIENKYIKASDL